MDAWCNPIRKGLIVAWYGAIADIPGGWVLCDGDNGTPDLQNMFVPGAGDTYDPGDSGGADSQTHTFTGDGHTHSYELGSAINSGAGQGLDISDTDAAGTTDAADNRPQYYALAYIMKL